VGRLEDRLRRLEEMLVHQPTADEYLDARNRQGVRALHVLAERLVPYGFDGGCLFPEETKRMLAGDAGEVGKGLEDYRGVAPGAGQRPGGGGRGGKRQAPGDAGSPL
jgi:hypothetical protein